MKPTRCLLFGVGEVGLAAARMLLKGGIEIVGCYTRTKHLGADLGSVAGVDHAGITIQANAAFAARRGLADVALFCTTTSLDDLQGEARQCLETGINVVTIAEDALYPWTYYADQAAELDRIARAGGATLTSTGINDAVMAYLPLVTAAYMPNVSRIEASCVGNFGRLGVASLSAMPLGLAADEARAAFADAIAPGKIPPTYSTPVLRAMLAAGGFRAGDFKITLEPVLATREIYLEQLDRRIPVGHVSGFEESSSVTTEDGVTFFIHLIGKVFEDGDEEYQQVRVQGDSPTITLKVGPMASIEATAAIAVNRVPDVVAAPPGFLTLDKLGVPRFTRWR